MIKTILWDLESLKEIEIDEENQLEQIYTLLDIDTVEYAEIDNDIALYCDEEGLLKNPEDIQWGLFMIRFDGHVMRQIAGKILFANHNEEGEMISLTPSQIKKIKRYEIYKNVYPYPLLVAPAKEGFY